MHGRDPRLRRAPYLLQDGEAVVVCSYQMKLARDLYLRTMIFTRTTSTFDRVDLMTREICDRDSLLLELYPWK